MVFQEEESMNGFTLPMVNDTNSRKCQ